MIILNKDSLTAHISPEKGGTLAQLSLDGRDYLYLDEENLRSTERPRCGVPFLFPMFGRLENETYLWDGKPYRMGIHGFAHTSRWQVVSQGPDRVTLALESTPETKQVYPFDFRVEMTYALEWDLIAIYLKFINTGSVAMPYNFGFHPYFLVDKPEDAQVEARAGLRMDFASGKALPFGHDVVSLSIPQGAAEAGAALAQLHSPAVIHIPTAQRQITLAFDDSFTQMVFWAQAGKKFLCVEPINGSPNGLNTGNYLTLAPGETKEAVLRLRPR